MEPQLNQLLIFVSYVEQRKDYLEIFFENCTNCVKSKIIYIIQ
jgi:hypothetical protein